MVQSLSPYVPTDAAQAARATASVAHPVVDVHAHIYPAKIAQVAADSVGTFYTAAMAGDGTAEHLAALSAGSPISHRVVHSVAVRPKNVAAINNFIAQACAERNAAAAEGNAAAAEGNAAAVAENGACTREPETETAPTHTPPFIGFMAMHQDFPEPEAEIERAMALGLRGLKLHPDIQEVNLDDPRLMTVYEICQAKRLPVIIHTGDYRYDYSNPRRLVNVLRAFPDLVVDAAHFGGWSVFDFAAELLEHERCFVDASSSMAMIGPRRTAELCRMYGTDRVMFGSDYPMWSPAAEYDFFASLRGLPGGLGFTDDEFAALTWHNAERFLGFEIR